MRAEPIFPDVNGARLSGLQNEGPSWVFTFTDSVSITTADTWRLITTDGIVVTSEDHGHQFGLPSPVDASARVLSTIKNDSVRTSRIDASTGDLFLSFSPGTLLQFLQTSCGYEAWELWVGEDNFICTGGGNITVFKGRKQRS